MVVNGTAARAGRGHGNVQNVTGTVNLTGGQYYPITIGYDEGNGGYGLEAFYAPPGGTLTVGQTGTFLPLSLAVHGNSAGDLQQRPERDAELDDQSPRRTRWLYQFPSLTISSGTLSPPAGRPARA